MRVQLKQGEVTIRIHQRPTERETVSVIEFPDGYKASAASHCHPNDNFSKHKGLQISLSKAMKKAHIKKDERKLIWDKIFNYKYTKGA